MREIKFRVWDKEEKEFIYFNKFGFWEDGSLMYVQQIDDCEREIEPPFFVETNTVSINQFTGLKDSNGKEIYEGDIYAYHITVASVQGVEFSFEKTSVVEWRDGAFWVNEYLLSEALEGDDNPVIIGNIYENPELEEINTNE
ncbi:YopX family protein [Oceanobacillus alkalisoli]|uniref:YopX family protein n=1 Tax=Oceanobacillus alkalisoli TaxID=2925113 RepID=UPI001EE4A18C|nr:YopX family protein [Oceanobacillus alkalisoli]